MIEADRMKALLAALDSPPERQRLAVVLRHLDGFAIPEIAQIMESKTEAVESPAARGKRAIVAALEGEKSYVGIRL